MDSDQREIIKNSASLKSQARFSRTGRYIEDRKPSFWENLIDAVVNNVLNND